MNQEQLENVNKALIAVACDMTPRAALLRLTRDFGYTLEEAKAVRKLVRAGVTVDEAERQLGIRG